MFQIHSIKMLMSPKRRHSHSSAPGVIVRAALVLSVSLSSIDAQETLSSTADRLRAARKDNVAEKSIPNRVRETSWRLLLGELAARPEWTLSSGAYDALSNGLVELDGLVKQLEAEPELERQLVKDTQLTMRLDASLARRDAAAAKRDVSRASELERLQQLRELNQSYRDLTRQLVLLNSELVLGRADEVKKLGAEAAQTLTKVEEIAGRRRDFYLFQDEPLLEADTSGELQVVKELLAPVAADVQTHHQALQAMMLNRLAELAPHDVRQNLLEEAAAMADAATKDVAKASALAFYARGLSSRELGRLKTSTALLSTQAHADAAPQFLRAREAFAKARDKAREQQAAPALITEIEQQLHELESPTKLLQSAAVLTQSGKLVEATRRLEFGLSLQRAEPILVALLEARTRTGEAPQELEKFLQQVTQEQAAQETRPPFQLLRGKVRVLAAWQQIQQQTDPKIALPEANWRQSEIARLNQAREDLLPAKQAADAPIQWQAEAYLSLAEAGLILIDGARPTAAAAAVAETLSAALENLTHAEPAASAGEQLQFREAILAGRLAQGYLSLRLAPDYRDSAQLAFAAAADAAAKLPYATKATALLGAPALQALWGREDASNLRLAQEERFLRQGLQRFLPAALALKFGSSQQAAASLQGVMMELGRAEHHWSPQTALDIQETRDVRDQLQAEGRVLAVMGLIGAEQYSVALRYALSKWYPDLTDEKLANLPVSDIQKSTSQINDPVLAFAVALAAEEYATRSLPATSKPCREYLTLALNLQRLAAQLLQQGAGQRERFPYLVQMTETAQSRLNSPDYYLNEAIRLRRELLLGEARTVLDAGTRRHPQARSLRDALIDTMIDEANLKPEKAEPLLTEALQRLEESLKKDQTAPAATLLTLGNLREKVGKPQAAVVAYEQTLRAKPSPEQQLKARSRLVLLKLKLTAT